MAVKASMREIGRRIGQAIRKFSELQGLRPENYKVAGAFDERTERISLFYWADGNIDIHNFYAGIIEAIREAFPESPYFSMHVSLVVSGLQKPDELIAGFYANENETDLTEWLERA